MGKWIVRDDEANIIGVIEASDEYSAQDLAQQMTNNAIGVWIETAGDNP